MGSELVRLLRPLEAMMRWFDDAGVRGAIIGGVAASLLGKPRLTKDIDAVVVDAEAESLIESGAPYGFQPRIADAVDFARSTRMLLLRFAEGGIDIDLSIGALPFEYEVVYPFGVNLVRAAFRDGQRVDGPSDLQSLA